jgi:AhpD family alkylhydroperoxidase
MSQEQQNQNKYRNMLRNSSKYMRELRLGKPDLVEGWRSLHQAGVGEGALSTKVKELLALAIGVSVRCDGCIASHVHDALRAGATDDEIMETLGVAIMMGGGPSAVYATHAMEAMAEFRAEEAAKAAK